MIELRRGVLESTSADAILRPMAADGAAVTPAMRRLEVAAGPGVAERCRSLGELPVGAAVITDAGDLDAEYMIHVVVRSATQPVTATTVARALLNGLRRAEEWEIETLALPALGTGAGNLDAETAAVVMVPILADRLAAVRWPDRVLLVIDDEYEWAAFEAALHGRPAPADGPDPARATEPGG